MRLPLLVLLASAASFAAAPSGLMTEMMEAPERTTVSIARPVLGWICPSERQSAYQIQVSGSRNATDDAWDTGQVRSAQSINVEYAGKPLEPGRSYFWRVRTWDGKGTASDWSAAQEFRTGTTLSAGYKEAARYPLVLTDAAPQRMANLEPGRYFFDFGRAAYGFLTLHLNGNFAGQTLEVRFGERSNGDAVHTDPRGRIRYAKTTVPLSNGDVTYTIHPPSISGKNVPIPEEIGVVLPFRYVEVFGAPAPLTQQSIRQRRLHYPFNEKAATFHSSSPVLNRIWELCRYSMEATSFAGVYVDGDRERLPYEADAYINQLSHYAVDREYTLARYSHEFLLRQPTWPTEWKFHSIFLALADYLWTGDVRPLATHYDALRERLFLDRERTSDGLLRGFLAYPPVNGLSSDIVDWPPPERDGYVFREYNTVVNAFYLESLLRMEKIADAVHKPEDAALFRTRYDRARESFNRVFWDAARKVYRDGEGTDHASAHANFFPLAFGLVPDERKPAVVEFLKTKGMAPSVYAAQYLLEALYEAGADRQAMALLTGTGERSWWNMIFEGSTMTTEAWSMGPKANLDWNHAWGAAPGNLIARYVLGLRPLEPGFGKVEIRPRLGGLEFAEGTIPTIRGPVHIRVKGRSVHVELPGNMTAQIIPPVD